MNDLLFYDLSLSGREKIFYYSTGFIVTLFMGYSLIRR